MYINGKLQITWAREMARTPNARTVNLLISNFFVTVTKSKLFVLKYQYLIIVAFDKR